MLQLRFNTAADYHEAVPASLDEGRLIVVKNSTAIAGYALAVKVNGTTLYLPFQKDPGEVGIPVTASDTAWTTDELAVGELRFRVTSADILVTDYNKAGTVISGPTDGTAMT